MFKLNIYLKRIKMIIEEKKINKNKKYKIKIEVIRMIYIGYKNK